jgi:hypothetical protein
MPRRLWLESLIARSAVFDLGRVCVGVCVACGAWVVKWRTCRPLTETSLGGRSSNSCPRTRHSIPHSTTNARAAACACGASLARLAATQRACVGVHRRRVAVLLSSHHTITPHATEPLHCDATQVQPSLTKRSNAKCDQVCALRSACMPCSSTVSAPGPQPQLPAHVCLPQARPTALPPPSRVPSRAAAAAAHAPRPCRPSLRLVRPKNHVFHRAGHPREPAPGRCRSCRQRRGVVWRAPRKAATPRARAAAGSSRLQGQAPERARNGAQAWLRWRSGLRPGEVCVRAGVWGPRCGVMLRRAVRKAHARAASARALNARARKCVFAAVLRALHACTHAGSSWQPGAWTRAPAVGSRFAE